MIESALIVATTAVGTSVVGISLVYLLAWAQRRMNRK
jgi:hypothetical protein